MRHFADELFPLKNHKEDKGDLGEEQVVPKISCSVIKEDQTAICLMDVLTLQCPFFLNCASLLSNLLNQCLPRCNNIVLLGHQSSKKVIFFSFYPTVLQKAVFSIKKKNASIPVIFLPTQILLSGILTQLFPNGVICQTSVHIS